MTVLVTGGSGFLGKYILKALNFQKFNIIKIGRTASSDIYWDFFSKSPELPFSDLLIHCAGLAHKSTNSRKSRKEFYKVNELATVNLCEAICKSGTFPKTFIFISTVAVYGLDNGELISENDSLNPKTDYAKSKQNAEVYLQDWGKKYNVKIMILRLPLVVGDCPPGNLGSMINAIKWGYYFRFSNQIVRRSMVLAEDVANFIVTLNGREGIINLTDNVNPSYKDLENYIAKKFNKKIFTAPFFIIKLLSHFGDLFSILPINSIQFNKLTSNLTFSTHKAIVLYGWNPRPVIGNF